MNLLISQNFNNLLTIIKFIINDLTKSFLSNKYLKQAWLKLQIKYKSDMEKSDKFNLNNVLQHFRDINAVLQKQNEIPINDFCFILDQFCHLFAEMSSVLGVAFADVSQKATIIRNNLKLFPEHQGFFGFVQLEMSKNIHIYNGDNNKDKKAPAEWKKYNSTSRNLLRMMWFFSFLRSTFEQLRDKPIKTKLSDILDQAYDVAFGEKHSWFVRKAAKIAIATGSDRKRLIECVLGSYDEEKLKVENEKFIKELVPVHQALWAFYKKNNLTELE